MDPLSITGTVVGLTATCVQTAKALSDLKGKFQNANLMISAICTETTIISASLSRIQSLILGDPEGFAGKLNGRPDLENTLDKTLTSCLIVFDVLESEIRKIWDRNAGIDSIDLGLKAKLRYVWNEGAMQEILTQLRGLQTALTLLFQLFEADTMAALKQMMENNTTVLSQVAQRTARLRRMKPSRTPESIFSMSFETQSVYTGDQSSIVSLTPFSFDDEIVNSNIYRRVLAKAYARSKSDEREDGHGEALQADSSSIIVATHIQTPKSPTSEIYHVKKTASESDAATLSPDSSPPILTATPKDLVIATLSPERGQHADWNDFYKLNKDDIQRASKQEIERQFVIHELITSEAAYLESLRILRYAYKYRLHLDPSITTKHLTREQMPGCEDICHANELLLYNQMVSRQHVQGPWILGLWDIFQNWLAQSEGLYIDYAAHYPHLDSLVRKERAENAKFAHLMDQTRGFPYVRRLDLEQYMKAPLTRIQRYGLLLKTILKLTDRSDPSSEYTELEQLVERMEKFASRCNTVFDAAADEVHLASISTILLDDVGSNNGQLERVSIPTGSKVLFDAGMFIKEGIFRENREVRVVIIEKPNATDHVMTKLWDRMVTFIFKVRYKIAGLSGQPEFSLIAQFDRRPFIYYTYDPLTTKNDPTSIHKLELKSSPHTKATTSIVLYTPTEELVMDLRTATNDFVAKQGEQLIEQSLLRTSSRIQI